MRFFSSRSVAFSICLVSLPWVHWIWPTIVCSGSNYNTFVICSFLIFVWMEMPFSMPIPIVSRTEMNDCLHRLVVLRSIDRQHVLDCLPRLWMLDGIFISSEIDRCSSLSMCLSCVASERNHVDEFFTQSSLTQKPVVRRARWANRMTSDFFSDIN
jgi:hypothetical protein